VFRLSPRDPTIVSKPMIWVTNEWLLVSIIVFSMIWLALEEKIVEVLNVSKKPYIAYILQLKSTYTIKNLRPKWYYNGVILVQCCWLLSNAYIGLVQFRCGFMQKLYHLMYTYRLCLGLSTKVSESLSHGIVCGN